MLGRVVRLTLLPGKKTANGLWGGLWREGKAHIQYEAQLEFSN